MTTPAIRPVVVADVAALKRVIDATGLFPSDLLDGMMARYLESGAGDQIWLTSGDPTPDGLLYCAPEPMTDGVWNMLLLAVDPRVQGRGRGSALTGALEVLLLARGGRLLLVETSGLPEFEATRRFYHSRGFEPEARIRDFYQRGEDKIVFRKALR